MGCFKLEKIDDKVWELGECNLLKQESKYLLNSQVDKKVEINNVLDKINFKYHTNFIIFGIKNIELISEIYKRKTSFSTMIIIEITSDEYIQLEGEYTQLDFMSDKFVNLVLGNKDNLMIQLKSVLTNPIRLYNLRNIQIISMPYVKSIYSKEVHEITKVIIDSFSTTVSSCGNDVQDILMGMDNYINNWKYTFKGVDHIYFKNLYKGKPAIIVAAGPSIDKSIEYLKNIKGKALILCADAALDVLLDEGIVPDIVASIERIEGTIRFYQREHIPQEVVYVGANQVQGPILDRMSRIIFTGRTGDAFFREFNKSIGLENLNIGNNVSHILLAFAQFLGCSTVIFTGLDLAYPQGVTHAKRTLDNFTDEMKASYMTDMVRV
ncbi:MAG: 6-hydroxymethylpterin diphosphokinase MptE-like protein, partial [Ruminiclostridium sp.]